MSKELLEKVVSQKHLTADTVPVQFCSDWLKDEMILLFNEIERIRKEYDDYKTHYDQIFAASVVVPTEDYSKMILELEALRSENGRFREMLEKMSHLHKFELHCDPADFDFNAEDAYRAGSNNAYCEVTEMALEALNPKASTPDSEEKE